jgi:hypothetical protein
MPSSIASDPPATWSSSVPDLPTDFDPDLNPILAQHWFGIDPQELRDMWWRQLRLGHRLPAEPGTILIEGGR